MSKSDFKIQRKTLGRHLFRQKAKNAMQVKTAVMRVYAGKLKQEDFACTSQDDCNKLTVQVNDCSISDRQYNGTGIINSLPPVQCISQH